MPDNSSQPQNKEATNTPRKALIAAACMVMFMAIVFGVACNSGRQTGVHQARDTAATAPGKAGQDWQAPDIKRIPAGRYGDMIRYGRELIAHTARYLGPKGSVAQISNGMNCQNCHLDAGTRQFGNNYAEFIASYPKRSKRSGENTTPALRIAECFERSLAGQVPDTAGREVQAILAYMKWLGRGVTKGRELYGRSVARLPFMAVAASAAKGKIVYVAKCQSCHGQNGGGVLAADQRTYTYPPLWGRHSYTDAAGMYRIGNFAGFVKNNMPYGATYKRPQLTDAEAWNVAAFVNSQPRPHRNQQADWRNLNTKPIDFPFGPYADQFSEQEHKYGPYQPIMAAYKN